MPVLDLSLSVKLDGQSLAGSPFVRRVTIDEIQQFATEQATGGGYATLPITSLDQVSVLLLQPTQQVTVRLSAQSDQGIVLNAGGILLICDATIAAAASTNATTSNASGATAVLSGIAGGT